MPGKVRWQGLNDPRRAGELYAERWHTGEPVCFGHLDEPDPPSSQHIATSFLLFSFRQSFDPLPRLEEHQVQPIQSELHE